MLPDAKTRRLLLKTMLSSVFATKTVSASTFAQASKEQTRFISGAVLHNEQPVAIVFDLQGNILTSVPLSARAHGAASHPASQQVCLFARRPGMFMNTFDVRSPENQHTTVPVAQRHFYGHGAYSGNGTLLYATENDYEAGRGVLGVYDTQQQYKRVAEIPTGGIGPHDVIQVPDSALLVIANGGIRTHPDSGRDKLNIDTMQPCVCIIDSRNGRIVARHLLPDKWHKVSIRHLVCDGSNVWL